LQIGVIVQTSQFQGRLQHKIAQGSYFVDRNGGDEGVAWTAAKAAPHCGGDFGRLQRAAGREVPLPERRCYNNAQSIDGKEEKRGDRRRNLHFPDIYRIQVFSLATSKSQAWMGVRVGAKAARMSPEKR
jgi:hypothetical protein